MTILEAVIIACLVAAGACLVFAFIALYKDKARGDIEETAKKINEVAVKAAPVAAGAAPADDAPLKDQSAAHAALSGGLSDYVKALAELAGSLSKLRQSVAGVLMAFALLGLAGGLASIEDKVPDKTKKATVTQPK